MVEVYTLFTTFVLHHFAIGIVLYLCLRGLFYFYPVNAELKSWLWMTAFIGSTVIPFGAFVPDNKYQDNIVRKQVNTLISGQIPLTSLSTDVVIYEGDYQGPQWHVPAYVVYKLSFLISLFLLVWAFGSLWRCNSVFRAWLTSRRLITKGKSINQFKTLSDEHGVAILVCESASVPMASGLLSPVVLLPTRIVQNMNEQQLMPIILHEIAHIKRKDLWFSLFQELIAIVFWWSPMMRIFNHNIHINRELACDFRAVKALDSARQYAQSLIDCAKLMVVKKQNMLAVGLFSQKKELANRIDAALNCNNHQPISTLRIVFACSLLAIATVSTAQNLSPKVNLTNVEEGAKQFSLLDRVDGEALIDAVNQSDIQTLKILVEQRGIDIDIPAVGDGTALIVAVAQDKSDVVQVLIDMGANVNQASRGDGNPLIMAAMTGNKAIAQLLLEHGADVNAVVRGDETPLINATRDGDLAMTQLLVEHGADVNLAVRTGWSDGGVVRSPLNMSRNRAVTDYLIQQGAMK
jgi:beta-lactamase regulating signal transducer with metallopeptidase domain